MKYAHLIKSLQQENSKNFFKKIDNFIHKNIGHKLITLTVIDKSKKYVERIYTNNPRAYPLLGTKPIPKNKWGKVLRKNGPKYFLCKNKKEIKKIFFDHETIFSLGCGSIINYVVRFNNTPLGTINILDKENKYKLSDIKKIEMIGIFMMPFFIEYQSLMSKKLRRSNAKKN